MTSDPRTIDRSVNSMGSADLRMWKEPGFDEHFKSRIAHNIGMELLVQRHISFREVPSRNRQFEKTVVGTVYVMSDAEADTFQKAVDREVEAAIRQMANAILDRASGHNGMSAWEIDEMVLALRDRFLPSPTPLSGPVRMPEPWDAAG